MSERYALPPSALAPLVDPAALGFSDTSELTPLEEPIGQERAVEALTFGLRMQSPGFNLYVAGPVGSGKWTIAKAMVRRLARELPAPSDWCYVNNFRDPSRPTCLSFPGSRGRAFKQAMAGLIEGLRRDLPKVFESTPYLEARARIIEETESQKRVLFAELADLGKARGFEFEETPTGFRLVPLRHGTPVSEEEIAKLPEAERQELIERRRAMEAEIREFQVRLHGLDHEVEQRVRAMDRLVVKNLLESRFAVLRQPVQDLAAVLDYLDRVHEDILANYRDFLPQEAPALPFLPPLPGRGPDLTRYQVNLVVEHAADAGAPVVDESHPTYSNLIGKIERKAHMGIVFTDFTEIKAGALIQASGGFLILSALDVLRQPFAWEALKRAIKTREVKIEDPGELFGFSTTALRPQPLPVNVKVILVGPPFLYHLLLAYEEDFQKIFKVKADFDLDAPRDADQDLRVARFVAHLCREEQLPPFGADAVAELIRHGLRLAERRDRLSLRLSLLSDVVREAAFWAGQAGRPVVRRADVVQALAKKRHRADLPEQWVQQEIREGVLMVDLKGEVVGQVNGLSVHLLGDHAFGRPSRITARTFPGTKGVIDIQREAELAGHVHSKGVLTLAGYLAGTFAAAHPFALSATLTFEQTYSEVEGDSAALAELIAVLSSLADAPVRQALAVTGSVNQLGEVQPIGGVNEKIEGFFESCQRRGLTGEQGVVIPARNAAHLALRPEVVEAVKAGRFAVYAVDRVEQAVELLTGMPAGERGADGTYPSDSVFGRAAKRLEEMASLVEDWGNQGESP